MSMMPSQAFLGGLESMMGLSLRAAAMRQQRELEDAALAQRVAEQRAKAENEAFDQRMRTQQWDRTLSNDEYNRGRDLQEDTQKRLEREADAAVFGGLMRQLGVRGDAAQSQLDTEQGNFRPIAPDAGARDAAIGQMAGASPFMRRLMLDQKAAEVEQMEKQARGYSEVAKLRAQLTSAEQAMQMFQPGDVNHTAALVRKLALEGELEKRVGGMTANPMNATTIGAVLKSQGGPLQRQAGDPYKHSGLMLDRAKVAEKIKQYERLAPDENGMVLLPDGRTLSADLLASELEGLRERYRLLTPPGANGAAPGAAPASGQAQPPMGAGLPAAGGGAGMMQDMEAELEALNQELDAMGVPNLRKGP